MTEPGLSGRQLQELRQSVGMSAEAFAEAIHYGPKYYRKIEASTKEVPVSIKIKFKSVLLAHTEDVTKKLLVWDPGVQKLDIRAKKGGKLILPRKGVSSD